ncbi:MAG: hypothetical protein U9N10_07870 [Bacillota bacterium]|nr:hypothetical protein [Bacillota bacterium]
MFSDKQSNLKFSPAIKIGKDGVIRWVYEVNMWKNPVILITITKVVVLCSMFPALLVSVGTLFDGDGLLLAITLFIKTTALVTAILGGLMIITYPIMIIINGGKYCVVFEMDEKGINHIQMQKQFKKNQTISMITILAGTLSGNVQTTAAGLLSGSKQNLYCSFSKVKTVTINKKRHVIYVNETLNRNQVYVDTADFDLVKDYIIKHSTNAKIKVLNTM